MSGEDTTRTMAQYPAARSPASGAREGGGVGERGAWRASKGCTGDKPCPVWASPASTGATAASGARRVPPASGEEAALPTRILSTGPGTGVTLEKEGPSEALGADLPRPL